MIFNIFFNLNLPSSFTAHSRNTCQKEDWIMETARAHVNRWCDWVGKEGQEGQEGHGNESKELVGSLERAALAQRDMSRKLLQLDEIKFSFARILGPDFAPKVGRYY